MRINSLFDKIIYEVLSKEFTTCIEASAYLRREGPSPEENLEFEKDFGRWQQEIEDFTRIFKKSFTKEQYDAMLYRLKYLTIRERWNKPSALSMVVSLGNYSSSQNIITIEHYCSKRIPENNKDTLLHELMHMASTRRTPKGPITGFEIPDLIGINLNEGYTEYLTQKYFTKKMHYVDDPDQNVMIVKGIENIVGKENMEDAFFNANLPELIHDLEAYIDREEIMKLFFLIDRFDVPYPKEAKFQEILDEIARINKIKLDRMLDRGEITEEEYSIEYAIKVLEYKNHRLWSEATKVVKEKNCFMLYDDTYQSNLFEFRRREEEKKVKNFFAE